MATINTKNVHRTNFLMGQAWGADFVYDEMMLTGDGAQGEKRAKAAKRQADIQNALLGFAPTRALLRQFALPKPGEGPSKQERETGFYDVLFIGETRDGRILRGGVKGDKDPGYRFNFENDQRKCDVPRARCRARGNAGGVWTPGAALGGKLIARLEAKAGLRFALEN